MLPCAGEALRPQGLPLNYLPLDHGKQLTPEFISASFKHWECQRCGRTCLRTFHRAMPSAKLTLPAKIILMFKLGTENIFKETQNVTSQVLT